MIISNKNNQERIAYIKIVNKEVIMCTNVFCIKTEINKMDADRDGRM